MYEESWSIDTPDDKKIYGVTNRVSSEPSDKVIVMVHGNYCSKGHHPFPSATLAFLEKGYDVIRFDQYSGEENGRNIIDCTLQTHTDDLLEVLKEKVANYSSVFLIGHSYGGPVIMLGNPNVNAVSLWDPSWNMADKSWAKGLRDDYGDRYVIRWGGAYMFGKNMEEMDYQYTPEKCRELSQESQFPIQVIHAGKGILYDYGESWHETCPHETDHLLLERTGHMFEELETLPILFEKTVNWFEKHTKP